MAEVKGTSKEAMVYDSFFEDDNSDYIFYYTGKSNILGLQHPDYVYRNTRDFQFVKVACIKFIDSGDPEQTDIVCEDLTVVLVYDDGSIKRVNIEANFLAKNCVPNANSAYVFIRSDEAPKFQVKMAVENYQDEDNKTRKSVGIWLAQSIADVKYVCTWVNKSLAVNNGPINGSSFYPSSYTVEYLDDDVAVQNINLTNSTTMFGDGIGAYSWPYQNTTDKINSINTNFANYVPTFTQVGIVYDVDFKPSATETIMKPTSIKKFSNLYENNASRTFLNKLKIDTVNNCIVLPKGFYQIQVKNGFYMIQGESRLDVNAYVGDVVDSELCVSSYLTSNNQTDARKAIKSHPVSLAKYISVNSDSTFKLKVVAPNTPNNAVYENETEVLITFIRPVV